MAGACFAQTPSLDLAAIAAFGERLDGAIRAANWAEAEILARSYADAGDFSAHVGASVAEELVRHEELLAVAEAVLHRAIAANSLENLALLGPENASDLKLRMDYGRLYSMQALVYRKTRRLALADSSMGRALGYLTGAVRPQAVDLLRAGLIAQALGRREQAWELVQRALLSDTSVEAGDPTYAAELAQLVEAREGHPVDLAVYLAGLRRQHAAPVPDLALVRSDGTRFSLHALRGQAVFINFFSPLCGTRRQELPAARILCQKHAVPGRAVFLFILNQPGLAEQTARLLAQIGLPMEHVVTLAQGNAYDYIPGEPTVWLVDAAGRLVAQHTGYRAGDEATYEKELLQAGGGAPPAE
ncbi:MAG: TlpA disulfide reductase family protein [Candidatus Latescibacterota bacterium]